MSSALSIDAVRSSRAAAAERPRTTSATSSRTITVGLLGFGNIGQAVARLGAGDRLLPRGWRFRVGGALVRDVTRRRSEGATLTADPSSFLRGRYDVVIDALAGVEPARTLVARLLGQGVPVVTANKALVAAHGRGLGALAALAGTSFRDEASALAGVPFLGALRSRPLLSDLDRCAAVVNGTSNFILSAIDAEGSTFDHALDAARKLGLAEPDPDPSRDLDGHDAADTLVLLASLFGWGRLPAGAIETRGIRGVTPPDCAAARSLGATIKPVACAWRDGASLAAFVGPALVPARHPLAALHGTLSGIQLSGRFVSNLFFSGPGAGPDVTAATLLDDAIESVSSVPIGRSARRVTVPPALVSAVTEWFIRADFPGLVPDAATLRGACAGFGLDVRDVTDAAGNARWLRAGPATRDRIADVETRLLETHRIRCVSLRALG